MLGYCVLQIQFPDFGRCKDIERCHLRGKQPYWVSERKDNVCMKVEFNSRRLGLGHHNMAARPLFFNANMADETHH